MSKLDEIIKNMKYGDIDNSFIVHALVHYTRKLEKVAEAAKNISCERMIANGSYEISGRGLDALNEALKELETE